MIRKTLFALILALGLVSSSATVVSAPLDLPTCLPCDESK